jgi:hypothetical protein
MLVRYDPSLFFTSRADAKDGCCHVCTFPLDSHMAGLSFFDQLSHDRILFCQHDNPIRPSDVYTLGLERISLNCAYKDILFFIETKHFKNLSRVTFYIDKTDLDTMDMEKKLSFLLGIVLINYPAVTLQFDTCCYSFASPFINCPLQKGSMLSLQFIQEQYTGYHLNEMLPSPEHLYKLLRRVSIRTKNKLRWCLPPSKSIEDIDKESWIQVIFASPKHVDLEFCLTDLGWLSQMVKMKTILKKLCQSKVVHFVLEVENIRHGKAVLKEWEQLSFLPLKVVSLVFLDKILRYSVYNLCTVLLSHPTLSYIYFDCPRKTSFSLTDMKRLLLATQFRGLCFQNIHRAASDKLDKITCGPNLLSLAIEKMSCTTCDEKSESCVLCQNMCDHLQKKVAENVLRLYLWKSVCIFVRFFRANVKNSVSHSVAALLPTICQMSLEAQTHVLDMNPLHFKFISRFSMSKFCQSLIHPHLTTVVVQKKRHRDLY